MSWYTEGEKTNPADGAILADTGKIDTGNNTDTTLVVSATVAAVVLVQRRDSARTNTVMSQTVRVLANDTKVIPLGRQVLDLGESIRVLASGVTVGAVQASIVY